MKKIIALALCLFMLLGCAAAEPAEKQHMGTVSMNGVFTLQCTLPEGYSLTELTADDASYIAMISAGDERPDMFLSIAFDELLSGVDRLNDLDDEALAKIEATFREEDEVDISYTETAHGTKLMMVKEIKEKIDYVDFYTIYKGYEIEFLLTGSMDDSEAGLTEEQIQMAVDFLSDLDFVSQEAAE